MESGAKGVLCKESCPPICSFTRMTITIVVLARYHVAMSRSSPPPRAGSQCCLRAYHLGTTANGGLQHVARLVRRGDWPLVDVTQTCTRQLMGFELGCACSFHGLRTLVSPVSFTGGPYPSSLLQQMRIAENEARGWTAWLALRLCPALACGGYVIIRGRQ